MKKSLWYWLQIILGAGLLIFGLLIFVLVWAGYVQAAREIDMPYHTSEEVENILQSLISAYDGERATIGYTEEGEPVYAYKFGKGSVFMFDGRTHGPEDCGTEAGIDFIEWVYESKDSEAEQIKKNSSLVFIPIINKDRPTSRLNANGVNLNRNFPNGWGSSGTSYPGEDYRGPSESSESETRAVITAIRMYDPRVYFNVHCGMEVITGGGNGTNELIKIYNRLDHKETSRYYAPHNAGCGMGGQVKSYACDDNTTAWLYEVSDWPSLPGNLSGYLQKWRPVYLPIYEAAALYSSTLDVARVEETTSEEIANNTILENISINQSSPVVITHNSTVKNETNNEKPRPKPSQTGLSRGLVFRLERAAVHLIQRVKANLSKVTLSKVKL